MKAASAVAASVAATAARAAKKRTAKLPNQLRAGAEKVERWKELELTKIMVGKLRVRDMFRAWRLKMALTGSVLQHKQSMDLSDRLIKQRDELQAKYDELEARHRQMLVLVPEVKHIFEYKLRVTRSLNVTNDPTSLLTGPAGWLGPRLLAGFTNWLYNSICFCNWPDWPGTTN